MSTFEYKSRKLDAVLVFVMPDNGGYIKVWRGDELRQICKRGGFMGSTISAKPETFEKECRKWVRQYVQTKPERYRIDFSTGAVYDYTNGDYLFDGYLNGRTLAQYKRDQELCY